MASQPKISRIDFYDLSFEGKESDDEYRKKREKNNEAVKKSREKSRLKKQEVSLKMDVLKKENSELELQIESLNEELATLKKNLLLTVAGKKEDSKTESGNKNSDNKVMKHDNVTQRSSFDNKKPVHKIQNKNLPNSTNLGMFSQQPIKSNQLNNRKIINLQKPQTNPLVSEKLQKNIVFLNKNLVNKNIYHTSKNKINNTINTNINNNIFDNNNFNRENTLPDFLKENHKNGESLAFQQLPTAYNNTTHNSTAPNDLIYQNNVINNNIAFNNNILHNNIACNNITHKNTDITNITKETLPSLHFNDLNVDNDFDAYFNENLDNNVPLVDTITSDINNRISTPPPSNLVNSFVEKLVHKRT